MESEQTAKYLVSSFLTNIIADLSVLAEAIRQIQNYHPWASTFENAIVDKKDGIMNEFAATTKPWALVMETTSGPRQKRIIELGRPDGRKFYHPVDKRRSKDNVVAMIAAEQNLDAFWADVDQNMRNRFGTDLKDTALFNLLSKSRILERTPAWVEPSKDPKVSQSAEAIVKPCQSSTSILSIVQNVRSTGR